MTSVDLSSIKKPKQRTAFTSQDLEDLFRCSVDPIFFIENFVKVQHPTKGAVPFHLYDFQKRLIDAYYNQRFVAAMLARQMGKSLAPQSKVNANGKSVEVFALGNFSWRIRLIDSLERLMIRIKT